MERNSVIAEYLTECCISKRNETPRYAKIKNDLVKAESSFLDLLESNEELKERYEKFANAESECIAEETVIYYSEGVRVGFLLCMDILGCERK